jgi:hypothetical protein
MLPSRLLYAAVLLVLVAILIQRQPSISLQPFIHKPIIRANKPKQHASPDPTQSMTPPTVAVLGTGLAGLCAAYELSKALAHFPQAKIVVFEKNSMLGGNSMKASSGINAVNPAAGDTPEIYAADTEKSGGGLSSKDLIAQLVVSVCCRPTTGLMTKDASITAW